MVFKQYRRQFQLGRTCIYFKTVPAECWNVILLKMNLRLSKIEKIVYIIYFIFQNVERGKNEKERKIVLLVFLGKFWFASIINYHYYV